MPLIHAYRRKSSKPAVIDGKTVQVSHQVELGTKVYKFTANEEGHFVCNVEDEKHAERLLDIFDAYKLYGEDTPRKPAADRFVIHNEDTGQRLDLGEMDEEQLAELCAQIPLKVDGRLKGDKLRQHIVDRLKAKKD